MWLMIVFGKIVKINYGSVWFHNKTDFLINKKKEFIDLKTAILFILEK